MNYAVNSEPLHPDDTLVEMRFIEHTQYMTITRIVCNENIKI